MTQVRIPGSFADTLAGAANVGCHGCQELPGKTPGCIKSQCCSSRCKSTLSNALNDLDSIDVSSYMSIYATHYDWSWLIYMLSTFTISTGYDMCEGILVQSDHLCREKNMPLKLYGPPLWCAQGETTHFASLTSKLPTWYGWRSTAVAKGKKAKWERWNS